MSHHQSANLNRLPEWLVHGVGKWHLGGLHVDELGKRLTDRPGPRQHGFDSYQTQIEQQPVRGRMGRNRTLFRQGGSVLIRHDQRVGEDDPYHSKHLTDANGDFTIELIEKLSADEKPFFINLWWLVPHKPYEPAPEPHWSVTTADGISMLPAFAGKQLERTIPLFWRTHVSPPGDRVALRIGDWKLVGNDTLTEFQLYEIQKDWKEERDLAALMPEKAEEMKKRLIEVWKAIESEGPDQWWKSERQKPVQGGKVNY